jgi:hypothetical protein
MAWLVALNERCLDDLAPEALQASLSRLQEGARDAPAVDAPREQWVVAVRRWLGLAA